jgi:DNA polymerase-3 subunit beta
VHFTIDRDNMLSALGTVLRIVPSRSPLTITTGLFIKAGGGFMEMVGTDLEVTVRCRMPVLDIGREGEVVIPARQLFEIMRRMAEGKIEIDSDKNDITVVYPGGEARIAGFPPEEFPLAMPSVDTGISMTIQEGLKEALRSVIYAAGRDELRPVFTGVQFEVSEGILTLAATDAHRLAVYELKTDTTEPCSIVIPAKALREVERALGQEEERVLVNIQHNQASFVIGTVEIYTRLIEGRFPDWRAAIPQGKARTMIQGETAGLVRAVERAQVLASGEVSTVIIRVQEANLTVYSQSELGGLKENVPLFFEGEPVEIAFNSTYLLEALKAAGNEKVDIELNGNMGPAVIRTPNAKGYLALVLPLRII